MDKLYDWISIFAIFIKYFWTMYNNKKVIKNIKIR